MEYKIEKTGSNVKVDICFTAEEWDDALNKAYHKTKSKYKIPGFRPGKASRKMIENLYGGGVFLDDAFHESFPKAFGEVCDKEELRTVSEPDVSLESMDENGTTFAVRVVVRPEVELGAYTGLEIEHQCFDVSDEEVDKELGSVRERGARLVEVSDRAAEMGDIAVIDYTGTIDGVAFAGGTGKEHSLELGSHSFIEGFEEQVVGMKVGEQKDVKVTFPSDYHEESLKGKPAVFETKLNAIKHKELPEIDDELAKDNGFDTVAEFKDDIKSRLSERAKIRTNAAMEKSIIEAIVSATKVEIPDVMIEEQIDRMIENFEHRLSHQGMKLEDYIKYTGMTMEKLREDGRSDSERAVKERLVFEEIIEKEKLTLEESDIEAKLAENAEKYKITVDEYKKHVGKNISGLYNEIIVDKLFGFLKANNTIKQKAEEKQKPKKTKAKSDK